jgi:hypothetical protein
MASPIFMLDLVAFSVAYFKAADELWFKEVSSRIVFKA